MKLKVFYGLILMLIFATGCFVPRSKRIKVGVSSDSQVSEAYVMSYNVENLFDTINDPENDDDFTPNGKLIWNGKRYQEKLNHIAQVVEAVKNENGIWPMAIGLIEVEHASCLNDLMSKTLLNEGHYQVAFIEGEDERGIDVGLLFRNDVMELVSVNKHNIVLPENDKTRHILEVVGRVNNELIVFYVNHWPSRSGGTEKSAPSRQLASEQLSMVMTNRMKQNPDCNMILMGDFNDYPDNQSVARLEWVNGKQFSNLMKNVNPTNKGSHFYKGEWGFLDQFIVNAEMMLPERKGWSFRRVEAVGFDFMMYTNSKGEMSPARTYVGDSYKGGYSDHLPILLELNYQK
jgi:predicted extracellular nuclease